jgi:tRNA (guanine37-N1)-methyltransferase
VSGTTSLQFDILTIFPEFFKGPLEYGMVRQALKKNLVSIAIHDLRDHAVDRHRTVDDRPFGGGEGMVLKPEPLFRAVGSIASRDSSFPGCRTVLLSAQGRRLTQDTVRELAGCRRLILICGRYEGVDERVTDHLATDEVSIGDYILSGGELAACVLVDCIVRMVPGVLHNHRSNLNESFSRPAAATRSGKDPQEPAILDHPQYTRPESFQGLAVPPLLLSGDHRKIQLWRRRKALEKTLRNRPDLLEYGCLSEEDKRLLETEFDG